MAIPSYVSKYLLSILDNPVAPMTAEERIQLQEDSRELVAEKPSAPLYAV